MCNFLTGEEGEEENTKPNGVKKKKKNPCLGFSLRIFSCEEVYPEIWVLYGKAKMGTLSVTMMQGWTLMTAPLSSLWQVMDLATEGGARFINGI